MTDERISVVDLWFIGRFFRCSLGVKDSVEDGFRLYRGGFFEHPFWGFPRVFGGLSECRSLHYQLGIDLDMLLIGAFCKFVPIQKGHKEQPIA